jgi:hypothetical protein
MFIRPYEKSPHTFKRLVFPNKTNLLKTLFEAEQSRLKLSFLVQKLYLRYIHDEMKFDEIFALN